MSDLPAVSGAVQAATKIRMPESLKGSLRLHLFEHSRGETINGSRRWIQPRSFKDGLGFPGAGCRGRGGSRDESIWMSKYT